MRRVGLSLHWTGACRHPECSMRRDGAWRVRSVPMHAAVIDRDGELTVFDPGYAPRFHAATEPFPDRLYRWITPAVHPPEAALAAQLGREGRLGAVTRVVLSHLHADHVAGLMDFPDAEVVCSRRAWETYTARRGLLAVASGHLKRLEPGDLARRLRFVEDLPRADADAAAEAPSFGSGHDLFGDGGVVLVPLPGHGEGQVGAVLQGDDGLTRFLIADATWSLDSLRADAPPPWLVMRALGDPRAYRDTWDRLRRLAAHRPELRLIPSHCPDAAAREGVRGV